MRANNPRRWYYLPDAAPPLAVQAPAGIDNKGGASFGRSQIWFGRLKMDWRLTDSLTLSSVSGYLDMTAHEQEQYSFGGVLGGVGYGLGAGLPTHRLGQFSQELRVVSDFGGRADFMLGAFYETRDIGFSSAQQLVGISLLGRDPATGNSFDWYKRYLTDTEALSVFGSADLRITDILILTGGVRWTRETKVATFALPYVHRFLSANPAFVGSGFESGPIHFGDSNLSPEVSLSYRPAYNLNFFAAFKTGFKSGGIDNTAVPTATLRGFNSPDPAVRAATAATFIFHSETARGGETGVKSQWLDGALTLNGSIYYYVFKNLQVQNFNTLTSQFVTTNAGELTTTGADLDFRWMTPVEGLSLFGSLAYTSAKYTRSFRPDPINNPSVDIEGRRAARAPRWAGNMAADLRLPVGDALELALTGNLRYSGAYFTNEDTLADHIQKAFVTLDLTVSLGDPAGGWQFAVVGSNLTDERSVNTSGPRSFLSRSGDDQIFDLTRGRQVSLEASFRF
jgi:iron complex outermembrane receptor protein